MVVENPDGEQHMPASSPRWIPSPRLRLPLVFLVCGILALPVVARLSDFAIRATYRQQIMFNEGWNTYHAHSAAIGEPLYANRPDRSAVNYPPLSFHLAGALGRMLGDVNLAGRWLSLVSLAWITACAALVVRQISGDGGAAAFAGLFCLGWFTFFAPTYVGANDPQLIGHALILTALLLYTMDPESTPLVTAACILCCAAGFVKLNLLAFPAAMSLDVLWRSRKRFALWIAVAAVTLAVFAILTIRADGHYFVQHLLSPRGYSFARGISVSGLFLRLFLPALAVCAVWSSASFRQPTARPLILALGISMILGVYFSGGSGVSLNVFFDTVIAMSMMTALAIARFAEGAGAGTLKWLAVIAAAPVVLSSPLLIASRQSPVPTRAEMVAAQRTFLDDVAYLKSRPGPAMCLNLLLCYEAGKALIIDPFSTAELMAVGGLDPAPIAAELTSRKFSVIHTVDEAGSGFPRELLEAFQSSYRLERRSAGGAFYVPKDRGGNR